MPFDITRAKPAKAPGFDVATAKPATAPGYTPPPPRRIYTREEQNALENERAGYEKTASQSPVENYMDDWRGALQKGWEALSRGGPTLKTYPEAAASALTGVTSLVTAPIEDAVRDFVPGGDPADADLENIRNRHVYHPDDPAAQGLVESAGAVFKPLGDAISSGGEFVGDTARRLGADEFTAKRWRDSANIVGEGALAAAGGPKGRAPAIAPEVSAAERAAVQARPSAPVKDAPKGGAGALGDARSLDFKITPDIASIQPERVGQSQTGLTRQKLSGPAVKPRFQVENQKVANARAAEDIGLDGNKPLAAQLQQVFDAHNAAADEVAATLRSYHMDDQFRADSNAIGARLRENPALRSSPEIEELRARLGQVEKMSGQQMLDAIRDFRKQADVSFQAIGDFAKHQIGHAYRDAANAMESALERGVAPFAPPELMQNFKATRVKAAKAHDVKSAMIGDNIDITVLKNIGAENLTGKLQQLARVAEEFPEMTRAQSKVRSGENSLSMAFSPGKLTAQRWFGRGMTERLLSDEFQNRFGERQVDTGLTPPKGPAAQRIEDVNGPGVDFAPEGGRGGPRAFRNTDPGDLELVPDPVANPEALPPEFGRPGDLTAETPPAPRGDIEFEPTDLGVGPVISRRQQFADGAETTYMPTDAGLTLADEMTGSFPGAEVPPAAALTEFATDQPIGPSAMRNIEDPALRAGDDAARREAILAGRSFDANSLASQLLQDPRIQAGVEADKVKNRAAIMNRREGDVPPQAPNLTDKEVLELQVEPAAAEFEAPRTPQTPIPGPNVPPQAPPPTFPASDLAPVAPDVPVTADQVMPARPPGTGGPQRELPLGEEMMPPTTAAETAAARFRGPPRSNDASIVAGQQELSRLLGIPVEDLDAIITRLVGRPNGEG